MPRIRRSAFRRASIVRKGSADARLSCIRRRHPRLHALLRGPLRQCGPLDGGRSSRDCGGRRDVLDEGRRRRCGAHQIARCSVEVVEWYGLNWGKKILRRKGKVVGQPVAVLAY
jgi:hypothetical protein